MIDKLKAYLDSFKIVMSNDPNVLEGLTPQITVEAEYGDRLVRGTCITLAHHGPRSDNPAPCVAEVGGGGNARAAADTDNPTIGLSHVDLDTLGGLIRIAEAVDYEEMYSFGDALFWQSAAFVDVNGPHWLPEMQRGMDPDDAARINRWMHAWWGWIDKNPWYPNRDGTPTDCKVWVYEALDALEAIFGECPEMMKQGEAHREAEAKTNAESFVEVDQGVVVRVAPTFVNHLYALPDGGCAKMVVAFNTLKGDITVSRDNDNIPVNCRELVQALWGSEAGGHDGIAGSPRDTRLCLMDVVHAAKAARQRLKAIS
jgi:hypothetical protein